MIKFFRHIRKRLLKENQFSKPASPAIRYLLYAIGEIILVVIGILIALQINNWNEDRKVRIGVNDQLQSMTKELGEDVQFYQDLIDRDKKRIEFLRSVISNTFDTLDLAKAVGLISFNYDKRSFGTAYQALKQSGQANMIDDPQLWEAIVKYFDKVCVDFNNRSEWNKQFVTLNVEPYIMENLRLDSLMRTQPDMVLKELSSTQMQNILSVQFWNHKRTGNHAKIAMNSASELIDRINKTLRET